MSGGRPPGITGLNYTPLIDLGTLSRFLSPTPGPMCSVQSSIDEMTPIASYMSTEMNANAKSSDVIKVHELNSYSATECISEFMELSLWRQLFGLGVTPAQCINRQFTYSAAALLIWSKKVMQNAIWDHKPIISRRFNPRNPTGAQHWHLKGNTLYYYDVWSNVHYGYVGTAAGFSESVLLDGAGLEQIGSTLLRGALPSSDPSVQGLRAWDDPQDRAGIEIGIQLYHLYPSGLSIQVLLNSILTDPNIGTKRYEG
ncbi:hypothetical protein MNBD_GAMMA18-240 [hydrothermal vent metagenome]|uniref:Bacterial toxin 44 domain-containing protein n=1 Tax=hydrothermal vent metagenome TaxID=652676 RepID=A0A3B0ZW38_9ZZZZ